MKIKYLFFPNELTKLIQSIYRIEDLRELDLKTILLTRKDKTILGSEYSRKLVSVAKEIYPNEKMRTHSFRKYFATQISRVNLTKIRYDIGSNVENDFKEHLLGHKIHYSSNVYNQILNDINQFYELWKPLEASLCIDCEIVNTTNEDILKLMEDKAELEEQLKTVQLDNREVKRVLLELFVKVYEIEDLNDLEDLKVNRGYDSDKTEKELKAYNERENKTIQYLLQIKRDLE